MYMMVYFMRGQLPWSGMEGRTKFEKMENIKRKKMETGMEELCKDCPNEFRELIETTRWLKFDQEPEYDYYYKRFNQLAERSKFKLDDVKYSWKIYQLKKLKSTLKDSITHVVKKNVHE